MTVLHQIFYVDSAQNRENFLYNFTWNFDIPKIVFRVT